MIPLYRKANWEALKAFRNERKTEILNNICQKRVEEIWIALNRKEGNDQESIQLPIPSVQDTKGKEGRA